jgi:hypothetical protein
MRALLSDGDGINFARVVKEEIYPFTQIITLATVPTCADNSIPKGASRSESIFR